jgi:hypothetical protein
LPQLRWRRIQKGSRIVVLSLLPSYKNQLIHSPKLTFGELVLSLKGTYVLSVSVSVCRLIDRNTEKIPFKESPKGKLWVMNKNGPFCHAIKEIFILFPL